jgi:hypothetical protein
MQAAIAAVVVPYPTTATSINLIRPVSRERAYLRSLHRVFDAPRSLRPALPTRARPCLRAANETYW